MGFSSASRTSNDLNFLSFLPSALRLNYFRFKSGSFVQRQKRIAIYHVKKFVKDSQLWKQTLSILPDFLENWHFISHFVWKSTKTLELLRIFDELFDVINGEPFLTLYKTSANAYFFTTQKDKAYFQSLMRVQIFFDN